MDVPALKLPSLLSSSTSAPNTDRPFSVKLDTHTYEKWRANIHRELEEDLQRQVRELLEETERQERLAKLAREKLRVGQYPSSKRKEESVDIWNEIDRRNEHVLNPLNSKSSSKSPKHFSKYYHQFTNNTAKSFYLNSYRSCRQRRPSSHHSDDRIYLDPTIYLNKYLNKQSSVTSINTDPSFLFGNSIIKSNKADILNIFDQQLLNGDDANTFVNKHGITIDEDGPFWPENYRILHPTPKLLSREMTPKEFYLSPSMPELISPQEDFQSEQYGNLISSSRQFLHNQRLLFFSSCKLSIDQTGPFWPKDFPIKYPPALYLSQTLHVKYSKEYYKFLDRNNQQTYDQQPAIYKYTETLKRSAVVYDMDKSARHQHIKQNDNENICPQLIFESRFEGGNLRQVKRVGQFEYELILRPDLYTRRHIQWYYFRVQNMIANITYRFRIINLMKKNSLYNDGMQILLFSEVDAKKEYRGWHRVGHHINYSEYKQRSYNALLERDINYYELDFQLEFSHSGDTCYIAHCYPYTFTDLKDDLEYLSTTRPRDIFRRDILCESQAGNSCFIITVTDESVPLHKKKFVFVTARIHPGETNSSYMMRGLLEFITSNDKTAQRLRSQLVFKIIPMLNPDGVIVGNYRCSLTGKDMNRNFRHPRKQTFPILYHMKELIQNLQKEQREILAFCDLHGHSRKSNVFAYGCDGCDGPQPDMKNFLNARVLPFIMSRTAPDMFSFDSCKFHIHRCKESTGRVVMWKEMLIKNSFTLEASFAGSSIVERPCHFNIQDYEKFGQCICQSLRQYLDILSDSTRLDSIFMDITKSILLRLDISKLPFGLLPSISPGKIQSDESIIPIHSVSRCLEILTQCHETIMEQDASSSSDSDSDPEGGELPDITYRKDGETVKKTLKKKRSDKTKEERTHKLHHKRQVKRAKSVKLLLPKSAKTESNNNPDRIDRTDRIRVSYPYTTAIDINSQLKVTLAVDQIDKVTRMIPEKGPLFVSKYANRTGHGLPIFTTERALERRTQKRNDFLLQDIKCDRETTDEYDTDPEPNNFPTKTPRSQVDNSNIIDPNTLLQQTPSLVSLPHGDSQNSPLNQTKAGALYSPNPMFKSSPNKRLHRIRRHQQEQNNKNETEQLNNTSPPIITMPNLMEFTRRLSRSSSTAENDTALLNTLNDSYPIRSFPKHDSPTSRTKMPIVVNNNNNNGNVKRAFPQKVTNYIVQQPLGTIESIIKERSISFTQENPDKQRRRLRHVNQIFKKQIFLPFEKK